MRKNKPPFVMLRKGITEHWPDMADGERILFITYLLYAQYKGPLKGWCTLHDFDLCGLLQWKRGKLLHWKKELARRGFVQSHPGKIGVFIPKYEVK